jgi:hypothetical protein
MIASIAFEEGKAVVVFSSNYHILHPGLFGKAHPFIGIVFDWIKILCKGFILCHRNLGSIHDPLTDSGDLFTFVGSGRYGIDTPVNEHAEAGFPPPFHAGIAFSFGLVGIGV